MYCGRIADVLGGLEREIGPVEADLDVAWRAWDRERIKRGEELMSCRTAAVLAVAEGSYIDCSPIQHALEVAEDHLRQVTEQQTAVRQAREAFMQVAQRYESFLEDMSSHVDGFLTARATGLEKFLATPAPGSTSGLTLGDLLERPRPRASALSMPPEFKEGNLGGPERRG